MTAAAAAWKLPHRLAMGVAFAPCVRGPSTEAATNDSATWQLHKTQLLLLPFAALRVLVAL